MRRNTVSSPLIRVVFFTYARTTEADDNRYTPPQHGPVGRLIR
jgi:hypothetical protein